MRAIACAALLSGAFVVLAAQNQQPIRVGTNFVRADVYPTRDGQIVDGLQAADFELLEDGVPQKIETFEHVIPTHGPQTARVDPNNTRDMTRALGNPRNRVFLLFLDGSFVDDESARQINAPLVKFLTDNLADDDLVGLMTSAMSTSQIVFGKKIDVLAAGLPTAFLSWGRKNRQLDPELDKRLIQYTLCYPGFNDVPAKMIARSQERKTLESLQDAVKYLASVREERKAIITVSEGWVLYREDPGLMEQRKNEAPLGVDKIRVGPNGKLTLEDTKNSVNALSPDVCDRERAYLANIDDDKFLREIIDDANRGNATFYVVDPGGLKVRGSDRNGALRTLAEGTDGLAVLNTNDLNAGLGRVATDMASYYLLGYYASNSKQDGRFRSITVRVKQPGIQIRARKGYRAPSANEVITPPAAIKSAVPTAATPVQAALDRLVAIRPTAQFRLDAVVGPGPMRSLWVVGELRTSTSRPTEFTQGATASIEAVSSDKASLATASVKMKPGQRVFLTTLDVPAGTSGMLDIRVRLTSDDADTVPLSEGVRVDLGSQEPKPLMLRRGPTTGTQLVPAVDPVFSRTERVRLEVPVGPGPRDGVPGAGRLLDRGGLATQIPVAVAQRTDTGTGQRWITADVNLAALSPGDYVIEVVILKETAETRLLTPIRVDR